MSSVDTQELPPSPEPGLLERRLGELDESREKFFAAVGNYTTRPFRNRRQTAVRRANDLAESFRSVIETVVEDDLFTLEEKAAYVTDLVHIDDELRLAHFQSLAPKATFDPLKRTREEDTQELIKRASELNGMFEDESEEREQFVELVCDLQEENGMADFNDLTDHCEGKLKGRAINLGRNALQQSGEVARWSVGIAGGLVLAKVIEHIL